MIYLSPIKPKKRLFFKLLIAQSKIYLEKLNFNTSFMDDATVMRLISIFTRN